jgi:hypothetical protein
MELFLFLPQEAQNVLHKMDKLEIYGCIETSYIMSVNTHAHSLCILVSTIF